MHHLIPTTKPQMADAINDKTLSIQEKNPHEEWLHSILQAKSPPSSCSKTQIHRVPMILRENTDHKKYYVPKVVSLGPYHHGNPILDSVQKFKPLFTNKLVSGNPETLRSLYNKLEEMVGMLRGYYEDIDDRFSDDDFIIMMMLDGCFILYFIQHIFMNNEVDSLGLKGHQIMYVQEDLFLLENQIPFPVLTEVMKLVPDEEWEFKIIRFINDNILATERQRRGFWPRRTYAKPVPNDPIPPTTVHLLELLQTRLTREKSFGLLANDRYTFRNVNELITVGIRFKPSKIRSLAHVEFFKCGFFASLELPPITVDDSTKPMLLNLVAYEMCSNDPKASWVTSYICLLDSLIDHSEDVKVLRKAGIIDNRLGSDKQVANLFNELGTDLVPNNFAYSEARFAIQKHYDSKRNTWITELKQEYIKSPWAFVALLGGLLGLFLSSVQAYFSALAPLTPCDKLCTSLLKMK